MQAQEQLQAMQDTIERIYGDAQVQLGIGAPTFEMGTVTPGEAKVRVRHNLKPRELSANATPSEFRRWRRKYEQGGHHPRQRTNDLVQPCFLRSQGGRKEGPPGNRLHGSQQIHTTTDSPFPLDERNNRSYTPGSKAVLQVGRSAISS